MKNPKLKTLVINVDTQKIMTLQQALKEDSKDPCEYGFYYRYNEYKTSESTSHKNY